VSTETLTGSQDSPEDGLIPLAILAFGMTD
jgi:hypothetical protein